MRLPDKLCLAVLSGLIISNAQAADYLADRHQKLGTDCTICHGPDKKDLQTPSIENCQQCHPMGVSGFLCLGRLFQGQPNEAALCI